MLGEDVSTEGALRVAPDSGVAVPPSWTGTRYDGRSEEVRAMGREQLEALVQILQGQLSSGPENVIIGSWSIRWDKDIQGFYFDKCEWGGYCEERPSVISLAGEVVDKGGPLFEG